MQFCLTIVLLIGYNKKNGVEMQTNVKVMLAVVMMVLTIVFVGFSVYSVLAGPTQNVTSDFTVNYLAPGIDAKMRATCAIDGGTAKYFEPTAENETNSSVDSKNKYLVFKSDVSEKNVGSLAIPTGIDTKFNSTILLVFEFVNTSETVKFKVSLTSTSTLTNVTMQYSTDGSTYDTTAPSDVEVSTNSNKNYTKYFYVKATVTESVLEATFKPAFNWKIDKVE